MGMGDCDIDDVRDICSICLNDTQDSDDMIYLCSEAGCKYEFCDDCLVNNLGADVRDKIAESKNWNCLICKTEQTEHIAAKKREVRSRSLYETVQSMSFDGDECGIDSNGVENSFSNETLQNAKRILHLLENIDNEIDRTNEFLDSDNFKLTREEISRECSSISGASEVMIEEEMGLYIEKYEKHLNILHDQISNLESRSDKCGVFDSSSFLRTRNERSEASALELLGKKNLDDSIIEIAVQEKRRRQEEDRRRIVQKNDCFCVEESVSCEFDVAELHDTIICKYDHEKAPQYALFPPLFRTKLSSLLLKALYYSNKAEREELIRKFKVAPEISIIMKYARRESSFEYDIELSKHLAPMLVKALRESPEPVEQNYLLNFYRIEDSVDVVSEDILEESEYLVANEKLVSASKVTGSYFTEVYQEDISEWVKDEDEKYEKQAQHLRSSFGSNRSSRLCVRKITNDDDIREMDFQHQHKKYKKERTTSAQYILGRQIAVDREEKHGAFGSMHDTVTKQSMKKDDTNNKTDAHVHILSDASDSDSLSDTEEDQTFPESEKRHQEKTYTKLEKKNSFKPQNAISSSSLKTTGKEINQAIVIIDVSSDSDVSDDADDFVDAKKTYAIFGQQNLSSASAKIKLGVYSSSSKMSAETKAVAAEERGKKSMLKSLKFYKDDLKDGETSSIINQERDTNDEEVRISSQMFAHLKPHQIDAVRFMWRNIVGSISLVKEECVAKLNSLASQSQSKGFIGRKQIHASNGCILAHCMGLGKTFSCVSLSVALLTHPALTFPNPITNSDDKCHFFTRVLVVAPVNTLQNWRNEYKRWTPSDLEDQVQITILDASIGIAERVVRLKKWFEGGGICIMGYQMFQTLSEIASQESSIAATMPASLVSGQLLRASISGNTKSTACSRKSTNSEYAAQLKEYLIIPGPDILIADEAHQLKNSRSKVYRALDNIKCNRRIALTGSPLQNNLVEYYTMVNFVKPRYLGSESEFKERYVNKIKAGEQSDATYYQKRTMRLKTYQLHKKLEGVVDRRDNEILKSELSTKREFVLVVKMTEFQKYLYTKCLDALSRATVKGKKPKLFSAFQELMRIWNHPGTSVIAWSKRKQIESLQAQKARRFKSTQNKIPGGVPLGWICRELKRVLLVSKEGGNAASQDSYRSFDDAIEMDLQDDDNDYDANSEDEGMIRDNEKSCDVNKEGHDEEYEMDEQEKSIGSDREQGVVEGKEDEENCVDGVSNSSIFQVGNIPIQDDNLGDIADSIFDFEDGDMHDDIDLEKNNILDPGWWRVEDSPNVTFPLNSFSSSVVSRNEIHELFDMGNKMKVLLTIIALSTNIGDKVLVFSQSIPNLDLIELVLNSASWGSYCGVDPSSYLTRSGLRFSNWRKDNHYFRIDGQINDRQKIIDKFNKPDSRSKVFLISTKAGNMGINLQAANRVVLFDSSWNPAHDLQAIYRSYRYGQKKSVYVYRLLSRGSMEEKIYRSQVTKMQLAARVVDAHTPASVYTADQLSKDHLKFSDKDKRDYEEEGSCSVSIDIGKDDRVLQNLLGPSYENLLSSVEDLDPLIADQEDLHLTTEEKQEAEQEDEMEEEIRRKRIQPQQQVPPHDQMTQSQPQFEEMMLQRRIAAEQQMQLMRLQRQEHSQSHPQDLLQRQF